MSISHWSCAQVADALRALGADPLPARVLTAALAFIERHKLDGADALDACGDDRVLAQWLPPDAYATDQRVRLLFGFDGVFFASDECWGCHTRMAEFVCSVSFL
jgi:hypothetical protein